MAQKTQWVTVVELCPGGDLFLVQRTESFQNNQFRHWLPVHNRAMTWPCTGLNWYLISCLGAEEDLNSKIWEVPNDANVSTQALFVTVPKHYASTKSNISRVRNRVFSCKDLRASVEAIQQENAMQIMIGIFSALVYLPLGFHQARSIKAATGMCRVPSCMSYASNKAIFLVCTHLEVATRIAMLSIRFIRSRSLCITKPCLCVQSLWILEACQQDCSSSCLSRNSLDLWEGTFWSKIQFQKCSTLFILYRHFTATWCSRFPTAWSPSSPGCQSRECGPSRRTGCADWFWNCTLMHRYAGFRSGFKAHYHLREIGRVLQKIS